MKTIVDSVKDPLTGIVNIRLRPQYYKDFSTFLGTKGYRFSASDVTFMYRNPMEQEEEVQPFLIYDFNDDMKESILEWDSKQK
jgi:hypothetical protein